VTVHCVAYLGMSLDGFIAGPNDDLSWLDKIPPPADNDMGFGDLMGSIDALVMGRNTFEIVMGFDGPWPYDKPVIVMSKSLSEVPQGDGRAVGEVELTSLDPVELVAELADRGMTKLYVDGSSVVTSFINAGLLDELITTVIPVVIGAGTKLVGNVGDPKWFDHVSSEVFDNGMVQTTYRAASS